MASESICLRKHYIPERWKEKFYKGIFNKFFFFVKIDIFLIDAIYSDEEASHR